MYGGGGGIWSYINYIWEGICILEGVFPMSNYFKGRVELLGFFPMYPMKREHFQYIWSEPMYGCRRGIGEWISSGGSISRVH